jgi:hypothetical protein
MREGTVRKSRRIEQLFLAVLGGLFLVALAAPSVRAQDYPTRPVTIVVPFTPGGTTDILARMVGQRLEARLGQSFLIENKPGAGSVIGACRTHTAVRLAPAPTSAEAVGGGLMPSDQNPVADTSHPIRHAQLEMPDHRRLGSRDQIASGSPSAVLNSTIYAPSAFGP